MRFDSTGTRHRQASRTHYNPDGLARNAQALSDWNAMVTNTTYQQRSTTQFDSYNRPIIARNFIGNATTPKAVTQQSYDNMQRLDCQAVRLNSANFASPPAACTQGTALADGSRDRIVKYAYDTLGNVSSTTSGFGTSLARTDFVKVYDIGSSTSTGTLTSTADARSNKTRYSYDTFNRLIKTCYVNTTGDCEQVAFRTTSLTGASQPGTLASGVTLRPGTTTTISLAYDAVGRVSAKSGAVSETFGYNNFNQLVTHVNNTTGGAAASESYSYNALGWLLSDAQPLGTVSYGYDAYGKRNQMTYPGTGLYVTYGYNDGDELTGIFENGSAQIASFGYDDYGRRTSVGRGGYSTTAGFDSNLRLQTLSLTMASDSDTVTLGYNPVDQISSRSHSNASYYAPVPVASTTYYGVNQLNEIGPINTSQPNYDARGNMTSDGAGVFSYNANNLMTAAGSSSLTYVPSFVSIPGRAISSTVGEFAVRTGI